MKTKLTVTAIMFIATVSGVGAALAPTTIGNKVLRTNTAIPSLRSASVATVVLNNDGHYVGLYGASRYSLQEEVGYLIGEPSDGTYSYTKTGDDTAVLEMVSDGGATSVRRELHFTSATSGQDTIPSDSNPNTTFSLTDLVSLESAPALNLSLRGEVSQDSPLIGGFVVPGEKLTNTGKVNTFQEANARDVLVRVVGPSLAPLGVEDLWLDPDFVLYRGQDPWAGSGFHYGDWSSSEGSGPGFSKIFEHIGAFPLLDGSKDAAQVFRLPPGSYTVVASAGSDDPGGTALIEVYFLP